MVYYETYFKVPASVWSDLHQLYFCAAQNSLHEITLDTEPDSIDLLYKQTLLMPLADPQHLAPQDMELVAEYIAKYADHTEIQPPAYWKMQPVFLSSTSLPAAHPCLT